MSTIENEGSIRTRDEVDQAGMRSQLAVVPGRAIAKHLIRSTATLVVVAAAALAVATPAAAATINVSSVTELQRAIATVNAGTGGDTIVLAPGSYAIASDLTINADVTIKGDPLLPTVLDGGGVSLRVRLLRFIGGPHNVSIQNLTLQNAAGAILFSMRGVFSATGVTIIDNGKGVEADSGVVISFTNSTIARNGIGFDVFCPELDLTNVTVSDNDVGLRGNCGQMHITNSLIVASRRSDCEITASSSTGRASFDSDGSCRSRGFGPGLTTVPSPGLGPLAQNGGPTLTKALLPGSPAINAGDPTPGVCPATDQRGVARSDGLCDIGAFEFNPINVTFVTSAGQFSNISLVPEASLPTAGKPAGVTFPFGLFSWTVSGLTLGQTITVTMTYPSPVASPAQYWKVPGGTWTNATALLGSDNGDNVLTLTITDGGPGDADRLVNGEISDPGGVAVPVAPARVSFASFTAKAKIERHELELKATFTLGAGSNGIAPLTEDVTLQVGAFSTTIPAGSFRMGKNGRFTFEDVRDGVRLEVMIEPLGGGRFAFKAEAQETDLRVASDPLVVRLTIGDDTGTTTVARRRQARDRDDRDDRDDGGRGDR